MVQLPPGVYTVTMSLISFTTFRREGVELTANFTATVNADLKIGDINETITVSGQSPVVDVQNTVARNLLRRRCWTPCRRTRRWQVLRR